MCASKKKFEKDIYESDNSLNESLLSKADKNGSVTKFILSNDSRGSLLRSSSSLQSGRGSTSSSQKSVGTPRGQTIEWNDIEVRDAAEIGGGTFGSVYRAKWCNSKTNISKDVAIKILHNSLGSAYSSASQKLEEEMLFIRRAEKLLDSDEDTMKVYGLVNGPLTEELAEAFNAGVGTKLVGMVMRYEPGGDLASYIKRTLSMSEKLHVLTGISSALTNLHSANIVHGDMKPANILLSGTMEPRVRLADFGVAMLRTTETDTEHSVDASLAQTQNARGTPITSAPEMMFDVASQLSDNPTNVIIARPSRKTDIYAFGVLAWEILAQSQPFPNITVNEFLSIEVHKGTRPELANLPADTPSEIQNMIVSCWSPVRVDRPTAAQCYAICSPLYESMIDQTYDIFLSHTWSSKPFVANIFTYLKKTVYRVWYDVHDMGHNLKEFMRNGVANSTVFLLCISLEYQISENCMFEMNEAVITRKPI